MMCRHHRLERLAPVTHAVQHERDRKDQPADEPAAGLVVALERHVRGKQHRQRDNQPDARLENQ